MQVDIARIQLLASALQDQAGNTDTVVRVLAKSGLSAQDLAPPAKLYSAHSEALFARHACDELNDILFGARTGLQFSATSSLTAYISKYSRDLRQVLENANHFHRLIDPAIAVRLHESGNSATIEARWKDPSFSRYHRRTEFLMFACIARLRALTGIPIQPIELRFQHKVGAREEDYSKLGKFPVVFGAEKLEIILPQSTLDVPVPTYDPSLRQHLMEYGDRLLRENSDEKQTLRSRVEGRITQSLPGAIARAEQVAKDLGMSPRTFGRRLTEEGTSFREIVDDLRCDLARTFLKNDMSLSEISYSLGYADQAAFSTAFKRWTGQSPSAYKDKSRRRMLA
ncbi:helix-turn-helix domain-containing protein [Ruegeria arenilitoris]|nr:AraC family transcriptional regulator [Ruegeria arenilitoris]